MKVLTPMVAILLLLAGCNTPSTPPASTAAKTDTLPYPFKASYSSDISVPGSAENAHKVLTVWKLFETADIQAMKPYFADTVEYDDASGMRFHGPAADLLAYAKKDIEGLDSMRFDIIAWQSAHINDRDEDWVNIWSAERRYPKGGKADTMQMQENWRLKDGRVVFFDQYTAKTAR
ncbi:MAG TPA: nuclear transport factor 2 family protein [Puia sp.]|jgi:hypothetical protein|nr:nuclear transport factor 2 family protein [Puia sp.]